MKSGLMRVDEDFKNYVKRLKIKLAEKGILVSERRITLAITRVKGQEHLLLNADWVKEEMRRGRL